MAELIKGIFVPDKDYIETAFESFVGELQMKFGIDTTFFTSLFNDESVVADVEKDYNVPNVGKLKLKFFDASYFVQGVEYFRPFIRGFVALMICLFHVRQGLAFFGYDAGVVAGRTEHIKSAREKEG